VLGIRLVELEVSMNNFEHKNDKKKLSCWLSRLILIRDIILFELKNSL